MISFTVSLILTSIERKFCLHCVIGNLENSLTIDKYSNINNYKFQNNYHKI